MTLWQALPTINYVPHCLSQYVTGLFCIFKCVGNLLCKGDTLSQCTIYMYSREEEKAFHGNVCSVYL